MLTTPPAVPVGRLLVTGAGGFVGRAFVADALARGTRVVAAVRDAHGSRLPGAARVVEVGDLAGPTDWAPVLAGVDVVVHLAARVHVTSDRSADPLADYRQVNVAATMRLAHAAAAAGVRRIVFASSVKAVGESTPPGGVLDDAAPPRPIDPYGVSKLEAEHALVDFARSAGIELTVLRPVLVVGPGARGNLQRLARAIDAGWPLPFGALDNRRSLLSLANLVDALRVAAEHPAAAGRSFLLADDDALSTADLARRIARAMGRPARLVPVPVALLRAAGAMVGRADAVGRLVDSLRVDASGWRAATGWRPPVTIDDGLAGFAAAFSAAPTPGG